MGAILVRDLSLSGCENVGMSTTPTDYRSRPGDSQKVRATRLRAGLTQAQTARLASCSLALVTAIEAGAVPRRSPTLGRILAVLAEVEQQRVGP